MNQLNIYNTYVLMTGQNDCNKAKAICEKYGLPMWKHYIAFEYFTITINYFLSNSINEFAIYSETLDKTQIDLQQFEELCEGMKK